MIKEAALQEKKTLAQMEEEESDEESVSNDDPYANMPELEEVGIPGVVPDTEEWMDIFGNGQLQKKVIEKGEPGVRPQRGNMCTITMKCYLGDNTVVEDYRQVTITLGDLDVIQGVDLAVALMELHEVAELLIDSRFAYGAYGSGLIRPNTRLKCRVNLRAIEPFDDMSKLTIEERLEKGNLKRERGNYWFIRKEFYFAIHCYQRALEYLELEYRRCNTDDMNRMMFDLRKRRVIEECIRVYNNLGAAYLEIKDYRSALEFVNVVLKLRPTEMKALLRKGKALKMKGDNGQAYLTFLEARKLEPENKAIQAEMKNLKEIIAKENAEERLLYTRMLGINEKELKDVKIEEKSKITNGVLWTVLGASAAVVGILVHRFVL